MTGSEDSHQLNFTDTGPVEIAITFSGDVCSKITVRSYSISERVQCDTVGTIIILLLLLLFIQAQNVHQLHQLTVQVRTLSDIGGGVVRW